MCHNLCGLHDDGKKRGITIKMDLIFILFQGGIKAVVWTDVVQGTVMLGSTILSVIYGVAAVGGLGKVFERSDQGGRLNLFE